MVLAEAGKRRRESRLCESTLSQPDVTMGQEGAGLELFDDTIFETPHGYVFKCGVMTGSEL